MYKVNMVKDKVNHVNMVNGCIEINRTQLSVTSQLQWLSGKGQ